MFKTRGDDKNVQLSEAEPFQSPHVASFVAQSIII